MVRRRGRRADSSTGCLAVRRGDRRAESSSKRPLVRHGDRDAKSSGECPAADYRIESSNEQRQLRLSLALEEYPTGRRHYARELDITSFQCSAFVSPSSFRPLLSRAKFFAFNRIAAKASSVMDFFVVVHRSAQVKREARRTLIKNLVSR